MKRNKAFYEHKLGRFSTILHYSKLEKGIRRKSGSKIPINTHYLKLQIDHCKKQLKRYETH